MKTKVIVETQQALTSGCKSSKLYDSLNQAVAVNPADLSTAEFLAPYTSGMEFSQKLEQIHSNHHH